ncbi:AhpC/TSA family protein [Chitinophaga silvatica]|uniref:AhpC/TSA family protein n=1 Tax=Chitinophaga silvatica TaxID=2282649 RepID=A0A3E1Y6W1_9BACT|nr:TlpA disulfide reductase family protein [Chitinophaga silvatica]RFS20682.1 AhpC/TSA family protein [Chitinophaga silvatica]
MKKIITLTTIFISLTTFAHAAFIVKVKFPVKPSNDTIYCSYDLDGKRHVDSAVVKEGLVTFTPKIKGPELLALNVKGSYDYKLFFIDEGTTTITTTGVTFKNATVNAGKSQALYSVWEENWSAIVADAGTLYRASDSATQRGKVEAAPEVKAQIDAGFADLEKRLDSAVALIVGKDANSPVTAFVIEDRYVNYPNVPKVTKYYGKLGAKAKASPYGKSIGRFMAIQAKTAVGTKPDFSFPDADGKEVKLSDFKGKYVLVDVWASWCGPCRKENPNVRNAYAKFHEKGFEVIGASLDTDKEKWLKAVEADGLTWTQLSDLKGWKSPLVDKFGIKGVPFNFLVDPQGKVIAKDLRGDALIATLEKVIK